MGLDGYVRCNCFPEQLRTRPPCPVDWLYWDDGYLTVKSEHDSDKLWHQVQKWAEDACPHRSFRRISERVANGTGLALFLQALENHDFPTLKMLDDRLEWTQAAEGLQEIQRLRQLPSLTQTTELLLGEELIQSYTAYNQGIFLLYPSVGLNAGVDPDGFFLQCRQTHQEVFRAFQFEHQGRTFRNLENGTSYETELEFEEGTLQVRTRVSTPEDFEYILNSLEALYTASVEMRQPIHWI